MKRSPASSCSSSTSSVGFEAPIEKRRPKHPRRNNLKSQKCKQNQTITGGRRSSIYRGVTRFDLSHCFFNSVLHYYYSPKWGFTCICMLLNNCSLINRHRWTGRFEAHLWDKSSWNNIQSKKGKQGNFVFCGVIKLMQKKN